MYDTALPHFPLLSTNFGVTWALQNPWASQNPGAPGLRAYLTDPEEKLFHDLGRWGWRQNHPKSRPYLSGIPPEL